MIGERLPDADRAVVAERKVTEYLLSETHPDGRGKAQFFRGYGFAVSQWRILVNALRRHAMEHPVAQAVQTEFGIRYVVDGILETPGGRTPTVRVIWFIERGEEVPRLVTAYPAKRSEQHDPGA